MKKVMHVEGLIANLIGISQLCDLNLHVRFANEKFQILDTSGKCILEGNRSLDNCYTLSQEEARVMMKSKRLTKFLIERGNKRGGVDKTLF